MSYYCEMVSVNYKSHMHTALVVLCLTGMCISTWIYACGAEAAHSDNTAVMRCQCTIYKHTRVANCSGVNLKMVPGTDCIPVDTTTLLLNDNNISGMGPAMFVSFPDLDVLNLSGNQIQRIDDETFKGLSKLTTLYLFNNQLRLNDSYPTFAFKPLVSLHTLHIQHNCEYTQCHYPNSAMVNVPSLRNLTFDGANGVAIGEGFGALENLESLVFDGVTGYCVIDTIPLHMFEHIRQTPVKTIKFLACGISQLLPMTFANIQNLTYLELTWNTRLCAKGIYNLTVGLNSTDIRNLHIIRSCNNFQVNLPKDLFSGIRETNLEVLDLSRNKLQVIDPDCIYDLPLTLTHISLRDNELTDASFFANMVRLTSLTWFDISYQIRFSRTWKTKHNKPSTDYLNRRSNYSILDVNMHKATRGGNMSNGYTGNTNRNVPLLLPASFDFINDDSTVYLPPNLKYILLNNMKIEYPVIPLTFGSNNTLEYIDASSNMLPLFLGPWKGLHSLKFFNLSANKFRYIHEDSFGYMTNLTTLLLDGNNVGSINTVSANMLLNLSQLQVLDLSNNDIKDLPELFFRSQEELKWLSLADNVLVSIPFVLDNLVNLEHLDLSNNQIQYLSDGNMRQLDRIAEGHNLAVNLLRNNLICNCERRSYIVWLMKTNINFTDKATMTCTYENGTTVSLRDIESIVAGLDDECYAWLVVTVCVVTFSVLLLLSSLFATLYNKRWQLRYLQHVNRRNINPYHLLDREEIIQKNDVYISFNDGNVTVANNLTVDKYVKDILCPNLHQRGIKFKIREELTPGRQLPDIIGAEIKNSRKLLVLLDASYCRDEWCQLEFNFAVNEGIYTKRLVVIPVVFGDVCNDDVGPDILKVLRSIPVLQYPGYEHDDAFVDFVEREIAR